ncbi:MAG: ABC transporter ATP-binding protein [Candidatus Margulisbacteria bacterium]|nr:ABC transporter ATP-binding protein [Candidatus Margulisiibacteriota bacterium]
MRHRALISFSWALRPYRASFIIGITSSICNKVLDLMPPLLVAWVIDTVQGAPPHWISTLFPTQSPWGMAIFLSALGALIFCFESITQWVYQRQFQITAQHVQHDIRCHTYKHLQTQDMSFFENMRLGQLIAIVNDDINQLERFLNTIFNELMQLVVLCAFALLVMGNTCWQLALFSLVPIPFVVMGSLFYQRFISPYYQLTREAVGELVARLENNCSGIAVIKSFTAETFELARVAHASASYKTAKIAAIHISSLYVPIIRVVIAFGFSGVLLLGSYWVLTDAGIITIGELVLFSMMIQRLLWPLTRLGDVFDEVEKANVSAMRIQALLNQEPLVLNPSSPKAISTSSVGIEFKDVNFSYDNQCPVLNNISFTINAGQTIGIAGYTGSGKSTIIKCLLRLYDIQSGNITLNNEPINAIDIQTLRQSMALVSQDIYLFHGSIKENIAYAQENNVSKDDIINAAKMAQLHDFIESLPKGYDSFIGEKGIKLSGGQRQRLSIARAILKNAPVMIFDEATSAVDTETERAIKQHLATLTKEKTALIIAHRLSTIQHADQILVINKGKITESGTHDTLMAARGDYHDLWTIQSGPS